MVAARIVTETVIEDKYRLTILGVRLKRAFIMAGDNMNVISNNTIPSSLLKKKHNVVAYHRARETYASKVMHFCHLLSAAIVAVFPSKHLYSEVFHKLLKQYLYRKPRIHKKARYITATIARKVN